MGIWIEGILGWTDKGRENRFRILARFLEKFQAQTKTFAGDALGENVNKKAHCSVLANSVRSAGKV